MIILILLTSVYADFGVPPAGWEDFKVGLVSDGDETSTGRLNTAVNELGIHIDYRYRYINEGVDPAGNATQWVFPKPGNGVNYSEVSMELTGTEASYVIYVLQEEGGTSALLNNVNDPIKARHFFHTLRIVGENIKGHKSVVIVEPDTWGYLMQDHYGTEPNPNVEVDPVKIPARVNDIPDSSFYDTTIHHDWISGDHDTIVELVELDFSYLEDLPNNLAGFGRAIIRTLHKYAPDSYVGFLASHWSVNLGLDGNGWNDSGMVWASRELIDTSAALNVEFFNKLYWGSVDDDHPLQEGDNPDFIGVEKNGWCAGTWEDFDGRTNWYWNDTHMENYLYWTEKIARGLDLPVVGWQISIGNMNNPNTSDTENMANAFKDTFFPYFFDNVDAFLEAGFIGFLVGKGLSQATDYTLPSENVGEQGWFFTNLQEFDRNRPYDIGDGTGSVDENMQTRDYSPLSWNIHGPKLTVSHKEIQNGVLSLHTLQGRVVQTQSFENGAAILETPASGLYAVSLKTPAGITLRNLIRFTP
jgi:hypothetical protein